MFFTVCLPFWVVVALSLVLPSTAAPRKALRENSNSTNTCRYLPGDSEWPSEDDWNQLNTTVGGRLIRSVPLAQPCYGPNRDAQACAKLQQEWVLTET